MVNEGSGSSSGPEAGQRLGAVSVRPAEPAAPGRAAPAARLVLPRPRRRQRLSFLRELDGLDRAFLVLLNFGKEATVTDLSSVAELPDWLTVVLSTAGGAGGGRLPKAALPSAAGEGLLLRYSGGRRYHTRADAGCFVSEKACYLGVVNLLYQC